MGHPSVFRAGMIAIVAATWLAVTGCTSGQPGTSTTPAPTTAASTPSALMTAAQFKVLATQTWPAVTDMSDTGTNNDLDTLVASCDFAAQTSKLELASEFLGTTVVPSTGWNAAYYGFVYSDVESATLWTSVTDQCSASQGSTLAKGPIKATNEVGAHTTETVLQFNDRLEATIAVQYRNAALIAFYNCPSPESCTIDQAPTIESTYGTVSKFISAVDAAMK